VGPAHPLFLCVRPGRLRHEKGRVVNPVTTGLSGVLVAGGKSRRMGQDKRFLSLGGRTLLERTLAVLDSLFSEVLVVVSEPLPETVALGHRVVMDLIPGCATLGGLYSGLHSSSHDRIFAVGCDMPFLSVAVIERLAELDRGADVVMPRLSTGLQPMHAIYSKACLAPLERMATAENLRVQDLCQDESLSVRVVAEDELRAVDPNLLSFFNINTPADLELALKLVAHRASLHE